MAKKQIEEMKATLRRATAGDDDLSHVKWFSTGSTLLDCVAGAGRGLGFASGTFVHLCGPSGSGKSFFTMETIAMAGLRYGDKLRLRIVDTEGGMLFNTQELYGFTIPEECFSPARLIEDFDADLRVFLDSLAPDEVGLYIVDSWDGLSSKETNDMSDERASAWMREKEYDKQTFGQSKGRHASMQMFPELMAKLDKANALVLVTGQIRDNFGVMYGPKQKETGGMAIKFYANARLWLKVKEKIEVEDEAIGVSVEIEAKKSRGDRPLRKCVSTVYFKYGVDDIASCLDYLYGYRTKEGKLGVAATRPIMWDGVSLANREEAVKYIEDMHLEDELRKRTIDAWNAKEERINLSVTSRKRKDIFGGSRGESDS